MPLKITSPLYASSVTGKIKGLGTFRQNKNGGFHLYTDRARSRPRPAPFPSVAAHLAYAKKEHAKSPKIPITVNNKIRFILDPPWSEYWAQYVFDNNIFNDQHPADALASIGVSLSATAFMPDRSGEAPGLAHQISATSNATSTPAAPAAVALGVDISVSSTARHQNKPP